MAPAHKVLAEKRACSKDGQGIKRVSIRKTGQIEIFPTTQWSLISRASGGEEGQAALNELCARYRRPLLLAVKSRLRGSEEAEDATQEYVKNLLGRRYWMEARQGQGKFRAFLQKDLHLFLAGWLKRARAAKRGGGIAPVPFDAMEQTAAWPGESSLPASAAWFDHEWALETLRHAWLQVRRDYSSSQDKRRLFTLLEPYLDAHGCPALYAMLAARLGLSEEKVYRTLHDLRSRFRFHFENLVRATVSDPAEVKGEVLYLLQALCVRVEQKAG